jgi:hypothetical protein
MPPVHAHESDRAIPRMRRGVAHPERGSAWHPTSDGASHFFRFSCSPTNPTCEGQLHQFPLELWRRAGRILRPLLNSGENLGMHYENETRQRSVCSVPRAAPRSTSAVTTSMRLGTGPRSRGRQAIVPGGPEPLTSERGRHPSNIQGGRETDLTVGVIWYPDPGIRHMANWINVLQLAAPFDRSYLNGMHPNIFLMRAQVNW